MPETKPSETQIQQRAYQLFLERGCEHGRDIEDFGSKPKKNRTNSPKSGRAKPGLAANMKLHSPNLEETILLSKAGLGGKR